MHLKLKPCKLLERAQIMRKPREWTLFLETLVVNSRRKGFKNMCGTVITMECLCAGEEEETKIQKRRNHWGDVY